MTLVLFLALLVVVAVLVVLQHLAHERSLQALRDAHVAEVIHIEDAADRQIELLRGVYENAWAEIRAEREQIHRLNVSRTPGDYQILDRSARVPDEDLGAAERHRAEALASRRPTAPMPSPALVNPENGDPIIPVGMGG